MSYCAAEEELLGGAQSVILPNIYSVFMNIIAWGPQVKEEKIATR